MTRHFHGHRIDFDTAMSYCGLKVPDNTAYHDLTKVNCKGCLEMLERDLKVAAKKRGAHTMKPRELTKKNIIHLLRQCGYSNKILNGLIKIGYFTCPASSRWHGAYAGGLAEHSLNVLDELRTLNRELRVGLTEREMIITALFHDLCKCGAYVGEYGNYEYNKNHPEGHGRRSSLVAQEIGIKLTETEKTMITYHMGMYGTCYGDYSVGKVIEAFNKEPKAKMLYLADELATLKEKLGKERTP